MNITYVFCSGFGFSKDYWSPLVDLLGASNVVYYQKGHILFTELERRSDICIGVGHSFGFLELNNSNIHFDFLIGLQGFLDFCGSNPRMRCVRENLLDKMIGNFEEDPKRALEDFYRNCEYTPGASAVPANNVDADTLIGDLKKLKQRYKHCGTPCFIIGTAHDKIVPASIIEDNFASISNVRISCVKNVSGHTLGYSAPEKVVEFINEAKDLCQESLCNKKDIFMSQIIAG
ncbi:MAG: hypothetical protein LBQ43_01670 [Holosporales bacterium]|jgi:pimeloyl-ACP methyl ester carboxylesterase|nr:hypothetical protein [Holosporales bacterium]